MGPGFVLHLFEVHSFSFKANAGLENNKGELLPLFYLLKFSIYKEVQSLMIMVLVNNWMNNFAQI